MVGGESKKIPKKKKKVRKRLEYMPKMYKPFLHMTNNIILGDVFDHSITLKTCTSTMNRILFI